MFNCEKSSVQSSWRHSPKPSYRFALQQLSYNLALPIPITFCRHYHFLFLTERSRNFKKVKALFALFGQGLIRRALSRLSMLPSCINHAAELALLDRSCT